VWIDGHLRGIQCELNGRLLQRSENGIASV
jgi:hypothetical protein